MRSKRFTSMTALAPDIENVEAAFYDGPTESMTEEEFESKFEDRTEDFYKLCGVQ